MDEALRIDMRRYAPSGRQTDVCSRLGGMGTSRPINAQLADSKWQLWLGSGDSEERQPVRHGQGPRPRQPAPAEPAAVGRRCWRMCQSTAAHASPKHRIPPRLESEEIRKCYKDHANCDKENSIRYKIRKNHEDETAKERNDRSLSPTIDEEANSNRTEKQAPKKRRSVHTISVVARRLEPHKALGKTRWSVNLDAIMVSAGSAHVLRLVGLHNHRRHNALCRAAFILLRGP
jgi:hypothetical protein